MTIFYCIMAVVLLLLVSANWIAEWYINYLQVKIACEQCRAHGLRTRLEYLMTIGVIPYDYTTTTR